jgi:uncharacterized membrane protein
MYPLSQSVAAPTAADWPPGSAGQGEKATDAGSSGMNKVSLAPSFMLALALIGIAVAFYDSYAIYTGQPLWCPPPIDGCNIVANSPYARIVDVPLGYFGVAYYLYLFGLAALLAFDPFSRGLRLGALVLAGMGVAFSAYFLYVQLTFIHAFCIYCLISALLTLLLFFAALVHFGAPRAARGAQQRAPFS